MVVVVLVVLVMVMEMVMLQKLAKSSVLLKVGDPRRDQEVVDTICNKTLVVVVVVVVVVMAMVVLQKAGRPSQTCCWK